MTEFYDIWVDRTSHKSAQLPTAERDESRKWALVLPA